MESRPHPAAPYLALGTATAPARVPSHKRGRDDSTSYAYPNTNSIAQAAHGTAEDVPRASKKSRTVPSTKSPKRVKMSKSERERAIENFKDKYTRAFPSFKFHFDLADSASKQLLVAAVSQLGATTQEFFSNAVTHLITNRPRPPENQLLPITNNKENLTTLSNKNIVRHPQPSKGHGAAGLSQLRSPASSRKPEQEYDPLVIKALQFGMKIWDSKKLSTILHRLLPDDASQQQQTAPSHNLSHLLATERMQGITHERDPTALRRDYSYFPRNSAFLLVEDMTDVHAPIIIKDYGKLNWERGNTGTFKKVRKRSPWPMIDVDGSKAAEGWPRGLAEPTHHRAKRRPTNDLEGDTGDEDGDRKQLRRVASMHNMGRARRPDPARLMTRQGTLDEALYVAASGNSVAITSNVASTTSFLNSTATTAVSSHSTAVASVGGGKLLSKRLHQQVLTNRAYSRGTTAKDAEEEVTDGAIAVGRTALPPPRQNVLKKSKSTNTLRLPAREENRKPGYCENCRWKFDDFDAHVASNRHQKYARNPNHFIELDHLLERLERRTVQEVEEADLAWKEAEAGSLAVLADSEDDASHPDGAPDEQQWIELDDN